MHAIRFLFWPAQGVCIPSKLSPVVEDGDGSLAFRFIELQSFHEYPQKMERKDKGFIQERNSEQDSAAHNFVAHNLCRILNQSKIMLIRFM